MPRFTVGGAVTEGILKAGGVQSAEALGIELSERGISRGTAKSVTSAVARVSKIQAGAKGAQVNVEWKGEQLQKILQLEMSKRLKLATQLVKDQVKRNISKSVLKYTVTKKSTTGKKSKGTRVLPESRSKRGEFPRADTTRLWKDIFGEMVSDDWGAVGTTLGYGLLLETEMDRSFLRRTLLEMQPKIRQILVKVI